MICKNGTEVWHQAGNYLRTQRVFQQSGRENSLKQRGSPQILGVFRLRLRSYVARLRSR